jgi:iron(III) transport system ATP-binding protein
MAHLELDSLTKRYPGVTSVDHIDLAVEPGEFICLLGPSGCGKTTTLRMLAGFLEPDEGRIRVGGKVVSEPGRVVPPERRNMGMIFQSYAIWPHMTVRDNVAYGLKMRGVDVAGQRRRTDAILAATRLPELAERYPSELSADSSSAWRSPARSLPIPRSCCSTSRFPTWTPTCAARCGSRSGACTTSSGTPRST